MAGLGHTLSYLPGCSTILHHTSPPPPPAWRTQMKSCLSWPPNVWLVMKCALIWSPVECISRRQQAKGGGQRAAGSWNLQIGIGNRQLASSAIWYHKSSIAACMTGRKGAFCAASHSNDMPKAKVACCTLPQAGYTYMCTVHPVCIVLETCMNAFTLHLTVLHRWILPAYCTVHELNVLEFLMKVGGSKTYINELSIELYSWTLCTLSMWIKVHKQND